MRVLALALCCLLCLSSLSSSPSDLLTSAPPDPLPPLMLWAWERPEDLRFMDPREAGVAYLAGTLTLEGEKVYWEPRMQPLMVPEGAAVLGVVRIEWSARRPPACTPGQASEVSARLVRVAQKGGLSGLQVDFDAALSQRVFYERVLGEVRAGLPPGKILSITALASWCLDDRWASTLPVDETVAMLFRMGPGGGDARRRLLGGGSPQAPTWPPRGPTASYGVTLDEPIPGPLPRARIYCFNPKSWSRADFQMLRREVPDASKR